MDDAFAASAFFVLKGTFVKAHERIFLKLPTLGTNFAMSAMVIFAVDFNHVSDCFLFAFHSFMLWVWGLWLHIIPSSPYSLSNGSNKTLP